MRAHMTVLAAAGKLRERAKASEMTPKEDPGTVPNLHTMYSPPRHVLQHRISRIPRRAAEQAELHPARHP